MIFFDYANPVEVAERNLPHWRQEGVIYFVTFRLADSIPQAKLNQWKLERACWLNARKNRELSDEELVEFHRLFSERIQNWLDAGHGSCALRNAQAAQIIADAMRFFDGDRYALDEWVVMPTHVHALVTPHTPHRLSETLHSWKSYSAMEINKLLARNGVFWEHESYDHIVRNEKQLTYIRAYIQENPARAGVKVAQASLLVILEGRNQDGYATMAWRK